MTRLLLFTLALALLSWFLFTEAYAPNERALLLSRVRVAFFEDAAGFESPPPRYGEPLRVELAEDPSEIYAGERALRDEDRHFGPLVRRAGGVYDPSLGHAARELAGFYAEHGQLAPSGALAFILDTAGVVGWGVRQAVVVTNAGGDDVLLESLAGQLKGRADRVGVGEAMLSDRRVIVSLLVGEGVGLSATPRVIEPGEIWRLEGQLKPGYHAPHLLISDPKGRIKDQQVRLHEDGAFEFERALSEGRWIFELLAEGPRGPTPLTQLTIYVGDPLPDDYEDVWPEDERGATDLVERAFGYINEDRERWGLDALEWDPALGQIAAGHSEDMATHRFVGHLSPTTGLLKDRLGGYRSVMAGENVALNRSLWDAEAGLMRSLGHRRNLLSPEFTHVGVGVGHHGESYYLTQVFSKPAPVLRDIRAAQAQILKRLNQARRRPLQVGRRLQRAAQAEARHEKLNPRRALNSLNGYRGALAAWASQLSALEQLELEGDLLSDRFSQVGIGLWQDRGRAGPDISLVILLGE